MKLHSWLKILRQHFKMKTLFNGFKFRSFTLSLNASNLFLVAKSLAYRQPWLEELVPMIDELSIAEPS